MRVLLVSANTLREPYPVYPLGLDYVAAAVAGKHDVRIADLNVWADETPLFETIDRFSPDIIGISLRNVDNTDTTDPQGFIRHQRRLIDRIRACTRAPIVLGGSGFTLFPAEIMAALAADYGIVGEGERLALLLDAIEKNEDPSGIPGVVTGSGAHAVPPPWDRPFERRFDPRIPHLDFYLKNGGMMNLQTKRGCRLNCIYCTYPHIEGSRQRLIDPGDVAQTARRLEDAGARYLFVTDSTFNSDVDHTLAVAAAFKAVGLSIPWGAFFMPCRLPDGYFGRLREAGLSHAEFGTESLSDGVLASYGKPYRAAHVLAAHRAAVAAGVHAAHYFLPGGPGETLQTLAETLAGVEALKRSVFFFFCGMRIYPHTRLYDIAVGEGQIDGNQDLLEPVFYRSPEVDSATIVRRVKAQAAGRVNWVVGSGGRETAAIVARLYRRGHTGPLWEYLIR